MALRCIRPISRSTGEPIQVWDCSPSASIGPCSGHSTQCAHPIERPIARSGWHLPGLVSATGHGHTVRAPSRSIKPIYSTLLIHMGMGGPTTTVRVSRETLDELERFQRILKTRTADETIRAIMRIKRKELVDRAYGGLSGRVSAFTEADRLENHC